MREGSSEASGGPSGVGELMRRHPVIVATLVVCTLLGAGLGPWLLTEEWSLARRLAAGAVAGAGTGFLLTATKMY
jgi:hypothetical protein